MKRILAIALLSVVVAGIGVLLFREPLVEALSQRITADMFVSADDDTFDPGPPLGARFPAIRAQHDGQVVADVQPFMGRNGLVFFANRSVDW